MNEAKTPRFVQIEHNRHGVRTVYFRRNRQERIRLPDEIGTPAFWKAYKAALSGKPIPDVRDMPPTAVELRRDRTLKTIRSSLQSAKCRAKKKGLPFDLDIAFLLQILEDQEFRCQLTGIEFFASMKCTSSVPPCTPSIDRIVPQNGYVKGNVRLVIYAMNAMLNDWGEDVFIQIANSYRYTRRTKKQLHAPAP